MQSASLSRRTVLCSLAATPFSLQTSRGESRQGPIRIGQIGTRHPHASGKISAITGLSDDFELAGVVEPDDRRRREVANTAAYQGVSWMTREELLAREGLSAVAVETSVRDLIPTALACVQAGKHVHLDKPAGPSMSAYRSLREEAERRGLTIQMGYMLRYNPAFEFLFDVVRQGWLGEITELTAEMGKMAGDTTRDQLSEFEGGGMFELGCHVIDAMVTVLGKPSEVTSLVRHSRPDRDQFADNQLAVYQYPTALATIRCNHVDPFGFPRRHFHVVGTRGTVEINPIEPPRLRLALDRPRGVFRKGFQEVSLPPTSGRYDDEFRDLAKVIRGEKELAWDRKHDLAVHEAVLRGSGMPVD